MELSMAKGGYGEHADGGTSRFDQQGDLPGHLRKLWGGGGWAFNNA
jgi:hypothetical protein